MRLIEGRRGYWGIAVYRPKTTVNVGTLWRTAHILGASFLATIGARYDRQPADTLNSTKHLPLFEYLTFEDFKKGLPRGCTLVAAEMTENAIQLDSFSHPQRVCYLLGAEDDGIPAKIISQCHATIKLRGERSLNLAVAGSIVMYHRGLV